MNATLDGLVHRVGDARVIFIDGRSGSGKTTLARDLAVALRSAPTRSAANRVAQVVGMDFLYPGWSGLAEGSRSVPEVLRTGSYRPYNWYTEEFDAPVTLDRAKTLIIEGCGSVSAAALAAARAWGETYAVWVECPTELRRERALTRDGEMFAPHWEAWAKAEVELFRNTQPIALADEITHEITHVEP